MKKQPSLEDLTQHMQEFERHIRHLRLALIIMVAFFVYDSLSEFRDRPHRLKSIETQAMHIVDKQGRSLMRLGVSETGAILTLNDQSGRQLEISPHAIVMRPVAGQDTPRAEFLPTGVSVHK